MENKKKLSFCITHKDRFSYLEQTLGKNLDDNKQSSDQIEFVLVDFKSQNSIVDWVFDCFSDEIKAGYLSFFSADFLESWSAPIAKNTTHLLAQGNILTNLDCDNYVGNGGGKMVIEKFEEREEEMILWQFSGVKRDGSYGRLSFKKESFFKMGGYDETLMEMGYQDNDLMRRSIKYGMKLVCEKDRRFNVAIKNKKYRPAKMPFHMMNFFNQKKSERNIRKGNLFANKDALSLRANVFKMNEFGEMLPYYPS